MDSGFYFAHYTDAILSATGLLLADQLEHFIAHDFKFTHFHAQAQQHYTPAVPSQLCVFYREEGSCRSDFITTRKHEMGSTESIGGLCLAHRLGVRDS